MAARRFGAKVLIAGSMDGIFTGKVGCDSTTNVVFVNQGSSPARIYLAYIPSTDITTLHNCDYLRYGVTLNPNSTVEIKGIAVEENHTIAARFENVGDETTVSCIAYGFEGEK